MSLGFIASCDHPNQMSDTPNECFCGSLDESPPSHIPVNGNKSGESHAGLSLTILPTCLLYYTTWNQFDFTFFWLMGKCCHLHYSMLDHILLENECVNRVCFLPSWTSAAMVTTKIIWKHGTWHHLALVKITATPIYMFLVVCLSV